MKAWIRRFIFLTVLAATLSSCAWLDGQQRMLVLRPSPGRPADASVLPPWIEVSALPVMQGDSAQPGHVQVWWLPQPDVSAPALLYLHGTFRSLFHNLEKIMALHEAGFAVLAVEYRGWGESSVLVPDEASIYQDAWVGWGALTRHQPDPGKRFVYGHSMGGAVAVNLAYGLTTVMAALAAGDSPPGPVYAGLIVESGFSSMPELAAANGFWGSLLAPWSVLQFDVLSKMQSIQQPVLVMHGSADTTVPWPLGKKLFDTAHEPKTWLLMQDAEHANLQSHNAAQYRTTLRKFWQSTRVNNPVQPALAR